MFWIKLAIFAVILLVVLVVGVEFSTLNADVVAIHYLQGTTMLPLSLVVVCAFAAGVVLTGLFGAFVVVPLRWQVARLRQLISGKDQEISVLSKKIERDTR